MGNCAICNIRRSNKLCINKACSECCSKSASTKCLVQSHKVSQISTTGFVNLVETAISLKQILLVTYEGGTTPGTARMIQPKYWITTPTSFKAFCLRSKIEKKYFIHKITAAEVIKDSNTSS